mgnify:CR=1 FL=1
MSMEYYEAEFMENKFFEYKAKFAAKGYSEDAAEKAAAEALDKFMEMYG